MVECMECNSTEFCAMSHAVETARLERMRLFGVLGELVLVLVFMRMFTMMLPLLFYITLTIFNRILYQYSSADLPSRCSVDQGRRANCLLDLLIQPY
jgi:hypothetical protein